MGKMSREKGKRGERELASILKNKYGYDCRRGQQYCGANGDADVVGLPYLHIEVKRVERPNIKAAIEQAYRDKKEDEIPVAVHRRNHEEWSVSVLLGDLFLMEEESGVKVRQKKIYRGRATMTLDAFMEMYGEYEAGVSCGLHKTES